MLRSATSGPGWSISLEAGAFWVRRGDAEGGEADQPGDPFDVTSALAVEVLVGASRNGGVVIPWSRSVFTSLQLISCVFVYSIGWHYRPRSPTSWSS